MSNLKELHKARRHVELSIRLLERTAALPAEIGQSVRWSNGVIWTRAGDDDWRSDGFPDEPCPSEHIASLSWEPVE